MSHRKPNTQSRHHALFDLYLSLNERRRPEDIAEQILEIPGLWFSKADRALLEEAARASLKRKVLGYSSMLQDFARPAGMSKQVRKAQELFASADRMSALQCAKPESLRAFIEKISEEIQKSFGKSDFLGDRMNREERKALGMDISRRRYNKLFRHLARMESKLQTLKREIDKLRFTKVGKSSLASELSWEEFRIDIDSACFLAYYVARCNLRSEFTIAGQERPFDTIAEMLLRRCERNGNWWAIAHAYPEREILAKLDDRQKGELLGRWFALLGDIGELLRQVWDQSSINHKTMIVRRGDDSSTWNNTAAAWNSSRRAWIALLYAMDLDSVLDAICPGKVMRLMAADVAAWHRHAGGELDPDTRVWAALPLPWRVLSGEKRCGREEVLATCRKLGVNADARGWVAPAPKRRAVAFRPTPELVHGVAVQSPELAKVLRDAGWFSGKSARPVSQSVHIERDALGFVKGAKQT